MTREGEQRNGVSSVWRREVKETFFKEQKYLNMFVCQCEGHSGEEVVYSVSVRKYF